MNHAAIAERCRITEAQVLVIAKLYSYTDCVTIFELLAAKRHRSSWRKHMDGRVRRWLAEAKPAYKTPLLVREVKALAPNWPITFPYSE